MLVELSSREIVVLVKALEVEKRSLVALASELGFKDEMIRMEVEEIVALRNKMRDL